MQQPKKEMDSTANIEVISAVDIPPGEVSSFLDDIENVEAKAWRRTSRIKREVLFKV